MAFDVQLFNDRLALWVRKLDVFVQHEAIIFNITLSQQGLPLRRRKNTFTLAFPEWHQTFSQLKTSSCPHSYLNLGYWRGRLLMGNSTHQEYPPPTQFTCIYICSGMLVNECDWGSILVKVPGKCQHMSSWLFLNIQFLLWFWLKAEYIGTL